MPFPLPQNMPGTITIDRAFSLPEDPEWLALVGGVLSLLINPENYEAQLTGNVSPDDAAEIFHSILDDFYG